MIKVENLTKRFGRVTAIDNVSFEVERGEIVGFLGPNGAGKTTTMRVLSCFLPATGGRVRIAGLDVFTNSLEVRSRIGYLPENVALYPEMRVEEYLRYRGRLRGLSGKKLRMRVSEILVDCDLQDVGKAVIGRLSKGYKQRIGLADSLLHRPELLILDEPTIGLDPNQIRHIRQLIKGLARHHTVLLSSHILPEVEMICSRLLIINNGRIVASDTPANLTGLMRGNVRVTAEIRGPGQEVMSRLETVPDVIRVRSEGDGEWGRFTFECAKDSDIREELFEVISARGWSMRELSAERRNLEDVFVALTAEG